MFTQSSRLSHVSVILARIHLNGECIRTAQQQYYSRLPNVNLTPYDVSSLSD